MSSIKGLRSRRISSMPDRAVRVFGLALVVAMPMLLSEADLYALDAALLAALAVSGLNLLTGYTGLPSVGNAALLGIGAYTVALIGGSVPLPFPLLVLLGGVFATVVSLVVALPAMRLRGLYLVIGTLALQIVAQFIFRTIQVEQEKPAGYSVDLVSFDHVQWYYLLAVLVLLTVLALRNIYRSRLGRALVAIRDSETVAEGCGIDIRRYKLAAFTITGFIVGCTGVLLAAYNRSVNWETFSLDLAVKQLAMLIIGGMGFLWGGVVGAIAVSLLPIAIARAEIDLGTDTFLVQDASYGLLIVIFMVLRPGGLTEVGLAVKKRMADLFSGLTRRDGARAAESASHGTSHG